MRTSAGCLFMRHQEYIKPSLNLEEQLGFLKKQGLIVIDETKAKHILKIVGYYRFSGYLLPFKSHHQHNNHRNFIEGTNFEKVWQLYQFDQELRLLVSDAIEKIEVAFRAAISAITTEEFGAFWYVSRGFYRDNRPYEKLMRDVNKIIKDKQEVFMQHYFHNYSKPEYPPIWMMIEVLSFGSCSKMFANIQQVSVRRKICEVFDQHPTVIESWIKTTVWIRNLCAHHARLWNRWLVDAPLISKADKLHDYLQANNRRFIVCAYILEQLLVNIFPAYQWKEKLYNLFEKYPEYPGQMMGFYDEWYEDPFWIV